MPLMADAQVVRELPEDRIQIPGMTLLDGQYIILVMNLKPVSQSKFLSLKTVSEESTNEIV